MTRWLVTLFTTLGLAGAYQVYALTVVPLTDAPSAQAPPPAVSSPRPVIFTEMATRHFADAPWTSAQDVKVLQGKDQNWFLFFQNHERLQTDGRTMNVSPLAILWHDPRRPDAPPYRLMAEKGRITFANAIFDSALLVGEKAGRIVSAALDGLVHIDGPDGLLLQGTDFKFTEDPAQLYSDNAVRFSYGPTPKEGMQLSGTALGLDMTLIPDPDGIWGNSLPRVGGIAEILLRQNVMLDVVYLEKQQPVRVQLTAGSLSYDTIRRLAEVKTKVAVTRSAEKAGKRYADRLFCGFLGLEFDQLNPPPEDAPPEVAVKSAFSGLQFRRLRATQLLGRAGTASARVIVESEEQSLRAEMQDLHYDALTREVVLQDETQVKITQGTATFTSPMIRFTHAAQQGSQQASLERLDARGHGTLMYREAGSASDRPAVEAEWMGGLNISPHLESGLHVVKMHNNSRILVPGQVGIAADLLQAWIDLKRLTEKQPPGDFLRRPLALQRCVAQGNVQVVSGQLVLRRAKAIDVAIQPGAIEAQAARPANSSQKGSSSEKPADPPWFVEADTINLLLVHDPLEGLVDLREGTARGKVLIEQEQRQAVNVGGMKVEGPLRLRGDAVGFWNEGGIRQAVTLAAQVDDQGKAKEKAIISLGTIELASDRTITLNRAENRVQILNPGSCTVPIARDLEGNMLRTPSLLTIDWWERMEFDGTQATCLGSVKATLKDPSGNISQLECEDLCATLNQRISFADPNRRGGDDLGMASLVARHDVRIGSYEYLGTKLNSVRKGTLSELHFYPPTGELRGSGPNGEFHNWSTDTARFAPNQRPQANQPATRGSSRWRHSQISFDSLTGNLNQRQVELQGRVKVLSGPVAEALVKFKVDQLSDESPEAENAILLKCQNIRVVRIPHEDKEPSIEMYATVDVDLEGKVFRARADEVQYYEEQDKLVMRGLGKDAQLWFQPRPGVSPSPTSARLIEFVPSKSSISASRASGLNGGL